MADLKIPKINRIQVSGRITKDLEIKYTPAGAAVLAFSVANDNPYLKDGKWENNTVFFNVVVWKELAESLVKNAKKGYAVLVEGRMTTREYTNKDNESKTVWEITANQVHVLEWKPKEESGNDAPPLPPTPTGDVPF